MSKKFGPPGTMRVSTRWAGIVGSLLNEPPELRPRGRKITEWCEVVRRYAKLITIISTFRVCPTPFLSQPSRDFLCN
jgi:hypothetical protein